MTAKEIIQKHARNNGDYIPDYEFPALEEAMNKYANERILSVAREAVHNEPEFPGSMPDEMWEILKRDRHACEKSHRIAVGETKQNILTRIESKLEES